MKRTSAPGDAPEAWIEELIRDVAATPGPETSPDLMARVMADARAHLPPPGGSPARQILWQQILDGLGGWVAVGGLASATAAGFVIGVGGVDGSGIDALWTLGYDGFFEAELGLDAYGWDLEEG